MHDGLRQNAITRTDFDHMESGGVSEAVPHLFQLARNQGAESRVTQRRRSEVRADRLGPGSVEASTARVQTGLHELGEGDSPMLLNEVPDLPLNRGAQAAAPRS